MPLILQLSGGIHDSKGRIKKIIVKNAEGDQ
jgi:hypothetical protein